MARTASCSALPTGSGKTLVPAEVRVVGSGVITTEPDVEALRHSAGQPRFATKRYLLRGRSVRRVALCAPDGRYALRTDVVMSRGDFATCRPDSHTATMG